MNENLANAVIACLECNFTTCDDCKNNYQTHECPINCVKSDVYKGFIQSVRDKLSKTIKPVTDEELAELFVTALKEK